MSKLPLILILSLISLNTIYCITVQDVKDFVKDLIKNSQKYLKEIEEMSAKSNNTEIIKMEEKGIESLSQSAQIMKLSGIRDKDLGSFINRFIQRLKLPEEQALNITDSLNKISQDTTGDWESYKFIYSKNTSDSSIYYTSVLAQHIQTENKSNWVYTELNSHLNKTDILIISKSKKVGNQIKEKIDIIRKPLNYKEIDIDLMMKFLEVASVKAFGNYLGVDPMLKNKLEFLGEY